MKSPSSKKVNPQSGTKRGRRTEKEEDEEILKEEKEETSTLVYSYLTATPSCTCSLCLHSPLLSYILYICFVLIPAPFS